MAVVVARVTDEMIGGSSTEWEITFNANLKGRMAQMMARVARVARVAKVTKTSPKMGRATTVASTATGHVSAERKRREKGSRWGNGLPHWLTPRPKDYVN